MACRRCCFVTFTAALAIWTTLLAIAYKTVPRGCVAAYSTSFAQHTGLLSNAVTYLNSTMGPRCFSACGVTSSINFKTWLLSIVTNSPLVLPYDDDDLSAIMAAAVSGNCKVRPSGAGHTEDGFVHTKLEKDIIVVNLANYVPPAEWNGRIDVSTGKLRVSAGASWLEVMAIARPKGFVMHTQTAGLFFSVGGVISNPSVHGATFAQGRINNLVTGLRVMLANGTSRTVSDPNELKLWRGSLGFLGIISAVEIQMRRDAGLVMGFREDFYDQNRPWNKANFQSDVNDTVLNFDGCEWFYYPWQDSMHHLRFRFAAGAGEPDASSLNYSSTAAMYDKLRIGFPHHELSRTGGTLNHGSAVVSVVFSLIQQYALWILPFASQLHMLGAAEYTKRSWLANTNTRRDLYYIDNGVMRFNQLYASIKCLDDCVNDGVMFTIVDASRSFLRSICDTPNLEWYPTMVFEWRILTVKPEGHQLLEHLSPGMWLAVEIISHFDMTASKAHLPVFQRLEQLWRDKAPSEVRIHHGKAHAYAPPPHQPTQSTAASSQVPFAFQNKIILDETYSENIRASFVSAMTAYDPKGLFRAGSLMQLLHLSSELSDVRGSPGQKCNRRDECMSTCCCTDPVTCIFPLSKYGMCTEAPKANGSPCSMGCECISDLCIFGNTSDLVCSEKIMLYT